LVNGGGAVALHRFVLDPVVAMCGGRVFVVPVWSTFPTLLIIVFSSLSLLSDAGSPLSGDGRGDPELNEYVGSAGTAVTIAQRAIYRAGRCISSGLDI
jgi:hypothetical protein